MTSSNDTDAGVSDACTVARALRRAAFTAATALGLAGCAALTGADAPGTGPPSAPTGAPGLSHGSESAAPGRGGSDATEAWRRTEPQLRFDMHYGYGWGDPLATGVREIYRRPRWSWGQPWSGPLPR